MDILYTILLSYFIGSIPFAFIMLKLSHGKDIREEGTGNVGAMNSFDVTGSKVIGVSVMLLDAGKGALAVMLSRHYFGESDSIKLYSAFFVTFGHCFPVWLKFKGGRGLATVLGSTLAFRMWSIPVSWLLVWIAAWSYSKNIHFCNISATISVLFVSPIFEPVSRLYFIIGIVALVLVAHKDVMKSAFKPRT